MTPLVTGDVASEAMFTVIAAIVIGFVACLIWDSL